MRNRFDTITRAAASHPDAGPARTRIARVAPVPFGIIAFLPRGTGSG